MTERVTRDAEVLAAWPQRGVCWKVVRLRDGELQPLFFDHLGRNDYRVQRWLPHVRQHAVLFPLWGFHCFGTREDALAYLAYGHGELVIEADYDGLVGIGHHAIGKRPPVPVLLCDRIRPRNFVTLPGCEVAQPESALGLAVAVRVGEGRG